MKQNMQAFTLIELLVVVLIIGILAAVALPKYQFAVKKARLVQAYTGLQAIRTANEVFHTATGAYTQDFTLLDIDFPGVTYATSEGIPNSMIKLPNGVQYLLDIDGYIRARIPNVGVDLEYHFKSRLPGGPGFYCRAWSFGTEEDHKLCKAMGGEKSGTLSGSTTTFYKLP